MISSLYAALLALMIVWLSLRVINNRRAKGIRLGDGGKPEPQAAIRAQGNATEYSPTSIILLMLLELGGGHTALIHLGGLTVVARRLIHAKGLITDDLRYRMLGHLMYQACHYRLGHCPSCLGRLPRLSCAATNREALVYSHFGAERNGREPAFGFLIHTKSTCFRSYPKNSAPMMPKCTLGLLTRLEMAMKPCLTFFLATLLVLPASASDFAIDIGHFTEKPGVTSASGVKELELNRLLARDVAEKIKNAGFSYHLIGEEGKMNRLAERTSAALGDRLFLSIHHDSVLPEWLPRVSEFSGFSLFVSRKNLRFKDSLACAQKIGAKLLAAGFKPSRYHALPVKGENRPFADEQSGIHFYDDLVVLKTAKQPAVLVEAGVVVNPLDEKEVTGQKGRQHFSEPLASGARECLLLLDGR